MSLSVARNDHRFWFHVVAHTNVGWYSDSNQQKTRCERFNRIETPTHALHADRAQAIIAMSMRSTVNFIVLVLRNLGNFVQRMHQRNTACIAHTHTYMHTGACARVHTDSVQFLLLAILKPQYMAFCCNHFEMNVRKKTMSKRECTRQKWFNNWIENWHRGNKSNKNNARIESNLVDKNGINATHQMDLLLNHLRLHHFEPTRKSIGGP